MEPKLYLYDHPSNEMRGEISIGFPHGSDCPSAGPTNLPKTLDVTLPNFTKSWETFVYLGVNPRLSTHVFFSQHLLAQQQNAFNRTQALVTTTCPPLRL